VWAFEIVQTNEQKKRFTEFWKKIFMTLNNDYTSMNEQLQIGMAKGRMSTHT